jgi:drug/metabolite transporter (DMT)-like permease
LLSIIYGLLSALTWGAGDFTGGLAARSIGAVRAVFYASIIGLITISVLAISGDEPLPNLRNILFAFTAGLFGTTGLILLYAAMSKGMMSIAAPVSALLAALLPVIIGIIMQGLPDVFVLMGFGFALLAVWMISQSQSGFVNIFSHLSDLKLPLLAGIGFGFYFILMHQATRDGTLLWTMVVSRVASVSSLLIYMLLTKTSFRVENMSVLPIVFLNGILDLAGNGFFILAAQAGRLDVASVLSSLYPGSTVLLAWIFLKERLTRNQWIGVIAALIAIILMTI